MEAVEGTEFLLWDDSITRRNLSFEPGRIIVQEWYFGEQPEPSIVTIILHRKKGRISRTEHTNIPDKAFDNIVEGWNEYYFQGPSLTLFGD